MPEAPVHPNEGLRLAALAKLRLMGTPAEERFDRITRMAQTALNVPIAIIDLVGDVRAWLKSAPSLPHMNVPRCFSYCHYTILHAEPTLIRDAKIDPRLSDNPYAEALPFYVGVPIKSEGQHIGVFCVCDTQPRDFSDQDLETFLDLAAMAEREINIVKLAENQLATADENEKLSKKALVDEMTRLWNRTAVLEVLARELHTAKENHTATGMLLLDVDHFKKINDTYGHPEGDQVLRVVADRLRNNIRPNDTVGRFGGEEFLVVLPGCEKETLLAVAERLRDAVAATAIDLRGKPVPVTVSIGVTMAVDGRQPEDSLIKAADLGLYLAKQGGRNRVEARWLTPSIMDMKPIR